MPNESDSVVLREAKRDLIIRKGAFSVIVKTLEDALKSGTEEDLFRGRLALEIFSQTSEQRHLADIPRGSKARRMMETMQPPPRNKKDELRSAVVKRRATPRSMFDECFSVASEGTDFSRHDTLSTRPKRHLLARKKRRR
jgi:hypothetical protein